MKEFGLLKLSQKALLSFFLIILLAACASEPAAPIEAPPAENVEVPPPAPVREPPKETAETPPPAPPVPEIVQEAPPEPAGEVPEEAAFDPGSISGDRFAATMTEVQTLIENLNKIIRAKNYNAWKTFLSESYFESINAPEFLASRTDELYKRDQIVASNVGRDPKRVQKKVLKNAKDYFDNIVVPSRQNDRVDDIAFVSENRVKAYTKDSRGNRLILYDLEVIDGNWRIIN